MERYEMADGRTYVLEQRGSTCTVSEERPGEPAKGKMMGEYEVCRSWIEKQRARINGYGC